MALEPIKKDAVYEDLNKIPVNMIGEIIDGELFAMTRPAPKHVGFGSALGGLLIGPYQFGLYNGSGEWWILDEPEIHFSDLKEDFIVPDIVGWKKERMPLFPKENYFSVVPDWICEILSPTTAAHDRKKKMPKYAKFGVSYFWIVDPINRIIEILKLKNNEYTISSVYSDTDKMKAEPFIEIEIDLKNLWVEVKE